MRNALSTKKIRNGRAHFRVFPDRISALAELRLACQKTLMVSLLAGEWPMEFRKASVMVTVEQLMEAGAVLPVKPKLRDATGIDDISARCYQHPALGDRPVVRLSADNLAAGDDLTMEFLGFAAPTVTGPVGRRRRQALGFPEWALVHDPKHARYALELVKEFKKEARRARSKPGHAYDAFTQISRRLGKSVAHFLPSFWEQTGREFIAVGNSTYASRAFGKAREAERVHGLQVDEKLRQDAFLEFALAGCVSAKALTEYGKELQAAHEPSAAWDFLRDLTVRRTLGGLPPWTSLCRDLQPLVKAAGRDPDEELQTVIAQIAESPAMPRAPMGFWKGASTIIGKLVRVNDAVAGTLLNLIPKTSAWRNDDIWPWLEYLDEWGILDNAWKSGVSPAAAPAGGPAAWFSRLAKVKSEPRQRLYDILEAMAERLRRDGDPLDLYRTERWTSGARVDLNLLDLALSLKIPVQDPPAELVIDLSAWATIDAKNDAGHRDRPRDPMAVAGDERFSGQLQSAVGVVAGNATFEAAASGKQALRETRRQWLLNLVRDLESKALPTLEDRLEVLEKSTSATTFEEFPEAMERLQAVDLLPCLQRTLQTVILDEYGWPALEAAFERFTGPYTTADQIPKDKSRPDVFGAFPYAIVTDGLTALVVRGDDIVFEAELQIPAKHKLSHLQYLDGDLLVTAKKDYRGSTFWNSRPQKSIGTYAYAPSGIFGAVLDMPDGGTFRGDRIVHAGDQDALEGQPSEAWYFDGTHFYRRGYRSDYSEQVIREVDPLTGELGRVTLPSFFEDFLAEDTTLLMNELQLSHYGTLVSDSPLGSQDGLIGFRVRRHRNGSIDAQGIDGRSISSRANGVTFCGMLNQPGSGKCLPVSQQKRSYRDPGGILLWDPAGEFSVARMSGGVGAYNRGQPCGLPCDYLHMMKLRDPATSKQLRKISDKQCRDLWTATQQDFEQQDAETARSEGVSYPNLDAAIRKLFPKLSSDRLYVGLRAVVIRYARKVQQWSKLVEKRKASPARKVAPILTGADATIAIVTSKFGSRVSVPENTSLFAAAQMLCDFLKGERDTVFVPRAAVDLIYSTLSDLPSKVWNLFWTEVPQGACDWIAFLNAFADTGIPDLPGWFRWYEVPEDYKFPFAIPETNEHGENLKLRDTAFGVRLKDGCFLVSRSWRDLEVLEYSAKGSFSALKNLSELADAAEFGPTWNSERLRQFTAQAAVAGRQLPDISLLTETAEAMQVTTAEVALIWLGYPNFSSYHSNFMPTDLREGLKLKTKDVALARQSLKTLDESVRGQLLSEMLSGPVEEVFEQPAVRLADRLKAAWQELKPNRLELPTELLDGIVSSYGYGGNKQSLLVAFNEANSSSLFCAQTKWTFKPADGELQHDSTDEPFTEHVLQAAAFAVPALAYHLPVGHQAHDRLHLIYEAALKALSNPNLLLDAGTGYIHDEKDQQAAQKAAEAAVGKLKTTNGISIADDGTLIIGQQLTQLNRVYRPARLKTSKQYEKLNQQLLTTTATEYAPITTSVDVLQRFRSKNYQQIMTRLRKSPVASGQYEANPLLSCPELVDAVSQERGLSESAATYYLQLLTLHDPTDSHVRNWNAWTSAALKKAGAELLKAKLVLEAKRARSGRRLFLPGGWEALKAPHLPLETWKLPLFQMVRDGHGRATPPLLWVLPLEPVHQLFQQAWQRVLDGDEPKYEEVA